MNDIKPSKPIKFDIEENAEDLFQSYLDNMHTTDFTFKDKPPPSKEERLQKKETETYTLDLHQKTLNQALEATEAFIEKHLTSPQKVIKLTIITGKGLRSGAGGSILAREIYEYVSANYKKLLIHIDPSPCETMIDGIPIRGHFSFTLHQK